MTPIARPSFLPLSRRIAFVLFAGLAAASWAQTMPVATPGATSAFSAAKGADAAANCVQQPGGKPLDPACAALADSAANANANAQARVKPAPVGTEALNGKPATDGAQPNTPTPAAAAAPLDETEFQRFVRSSSGQSLRLYGYDLFSGAAFGAGQAYTVPAGYLMGPGDELVLQMYGLFDVADRVTIDRDGRITLPKVGPLTLAGVPFSEAEKVITAHLARVYKNFSVSVSMGRLRSIEVFVLGQARRPGKQVVGSLSSLINALFETGGPNANGSLRAVQLRRAGKTVATIDLYKFLAKGDSSGDANLLNGDIIYIPPAGPRVGILGTVNAPAIYEIKPGETIEDVLALSGGLPALASPHKVQLDRVDPLQPVARYVQDFALDKAGLAKPLAAADVLTVFPISPQIANVVTLEGNGLNPMRLAFKPGMKVADILGDLRQLLPGSYWQQVNQGSSASYSRPEVNLHYATIQRLDASRLRTRTLAFNLSKAIDKEPGENLALQSGDIVTIYKAGEAGADTPDSVYLTGDMVGGSQRFVWRPGFTVRDIIPSAQWLVDYYNYWQRASAQSLRNDINWDYAQIIRRVPATLSSESITFNLADAVLRELPSSNTALLPGDQINLFTTTQVPLPVAKRIRMVTVSGEVGVPGVYQATVGETLAQIIQRAGGFTKEAYPFGLEFRRESTRLSQQQNLERLIQQYERQVQADSSKRLQNVTNVDGKDQTATIQAGIQADQLRLTNLRKLRASGRVSLGMQPKDNTLPPLVLEDGDSVAVPAVPAFVGTFGAVHNENAMLWKEGMQVRDVVKQSGLTNYSEDSDLYVMRADGSVQGGSGTGLFSNNNSIAIMPGDTVVVPEKADRETAYSAFVRGAKDWTSILAQFGLGAAALRSLGY